MTKEKFPRWDKQYHQSKPLEQRQENAKNILQRMRNAWGLDGNRELSEKLGCSPKEPSRWIRTGNVPHSAISYCQHQTGHSLEWLYYGKLNYSITTAMKKLFIKQSHEALELAVQTNQIKEVTPLSTKAIALTIVELLFAKIKK